MILHEKGESFKVSKIALWQVDFTFFFFLVQVVNLVFYDNYFCPAKMNMSQDHRRSRWLA
jgi:hypothetical protein